MTVAVTICFASLPALRTKQLGPRCRWNHLPTIVSNSATTLGNLTHRSSFSQAVRRMRTVLKAVGRVSSRFHINIQIPFFRVSMMILREAGFTVVETIGGQGSAQEDPASTAGRQSKTSLRIKHGCRTRSLSLCSTSQRFGKDDGRHDKKHTYACSERVSFHRKCPFLSESS